jgi:hypothetical protein
MKLRSFSGLMLSMAFFAACSSGIEKKVVIMSSGKVSVDPNTKVVTHQPGTQHNDAELTLSGSDKAVIVKSAAGEKSYELPENGLYLLNLQTDTLVGSLVNFGESGASNVISNAEVDHIIDSTQQLLNGQNASDEKKTYFITPQTIKKVATSTNAQLVNPFRAIPREVTLDKDGKAPEIYKFYTRGQKQEALDELLKRRAASKAE